MPQVLGQLVGRQAEVDMFDAALGLLDGGHSAAVEVLGEPGIGKTRVLAELAHRADARGHVVLSGSGSDLETDVPFLVFVEALDDYLRSLDPRHLGLLDESVLAELATVFPSLSAFGKGRPVALQHERYRSHRAVRELLELLANHKPLVLILDDIHWADPASVELLSSLLRRPPAAPVLLALGMRPRQIPERLVITKARAQRVGSLASAELSAFTPAEARLFLGDAAARADRHGFYEESGGNPFYLEQLARALERPAAVRSTHAGMSLSGVTVPGSVVAALAEELSLISPVARSLLEGASVAGDPFEPELAAAAATVGKAETLDAMNELLRLDLVRQADAPRRFRFRHPLLRRAVYESTPGGWRLAAHARCAEAIAGLGGAAPALAHHVEYSARTGDLAAVAVLRAAGEAAVGRAPANAARWFIAARRLLGDGGSATERAHLSTAVAAAQTATGQFAEAREAFLAAIAELPDGATADRVALTTACAGMEQLLGRLDEAEARLRGALAALPEPSSPLAASLLITLAVGAFYRNRTAESRDWGVRALAVAEELGDAPLTAAAASVVALACAFESQTADAERHRLRAMDLIDAMSDAQLAVRLDAAAYLTGAEAYLDHFVEATRHGERGMALARATGQGELLPILIQALGTALLTRGRLAEAADLLDGSIEAARLVGHEQTLAWSLMNRAFVAVHQGQLEAANAFIAESVDVTRSLDDSMVSTYTGLMTAVVDIANGNPERAVNNFLTSAGGEEILGVSGGWRAKYLELLTRSRLAIGRPDDAQRSAAYAEAVAARTGLPMAQAWAQRARAAILLDQGDAAGAAELAVSSADTCDAAGAPVEAASSRLIAGRALIESGQGDRAGAILERAAAALDEAGAERFRLEVERELRRIGRAVPRRSRPATGSGVASLTGREFELARLVVDRKTNPEIAATLFLSQKTVEAHLTNIFRKMQVTSRVELARAVERAEDA